MTNIRDTYKVQLDSEHVHRHTNTEHTMTRLCVLYLAEFFVWQLVNKM